MTPLVVENEPPVTYLRRKMTGGRFSMGVVIRRYTGQKIFLVDFMRVKGRRGKGHRVLYSFGPFCIPSVVVN